MICRRYFPAFIDTSPDEWVDKSIESPEQALEIDWIKEKIANGEDVVIRGPFISTRNVGGSDKNYVIALLLTDDKKDYIK